MAHGFRDHAAATSKTPRPRPASARRRPSRAALHRTRSRYAVDPARLADFHTLRGTVRAALGARMAGDPVPAAARRALNDAGATAPRSPRLEDSGERTTDHHCADPTTIAIAALAADAIELLGGPRGDDLRTCGAPGCVLVFLEDHPRRCWCSDGCGNRARQARHYTRQRRV